MVLNVLSATLVIACIIFGAIFLLLQSIIEKRFYKKSLGSTKGLDALNRWIEGRFMLALFFPRMYISKKYFWKGYLLYLLSVLFLILSLVAFSMFIIINRAGGS